MHRISPLTDSFLVEEQTMVLKITLQHTDLVLLENPSLKESFALVAHTSAVLNMSDPRGKLSANLELQVSYPFWLTILF